MWWHVLFKYIYLRNYFTLLLKTWIDSTIIQLRTRSINKLFKLKDCSYIYDYLRIFVREEIVQNAQLFQNYPLSATVIISQQPALESTLNTTSKSSRPLVPGLVWCREQWNASDIFDLFLNFVNLIWTDHSNGPFEPTYICNFFLVTILHGVARPKHISSCKFVASGP